MNTRTKYVIGSLIDGCTCEDVECVLIIPEHISHNSVERCFYKITSAGFFRINNDASVSAYGKSISLGVESKESDHALIQKALFPINF